MRACALTRVKETERQGSGRGTRCARLKGAREDPDMSFNPRASTLTPQEISVGGKRRGREVPVNLREGGMRVVLVQCSGQNKEPKHIEGVGRGHGKLVLTRCREGHCSVGGEEDDGTWGSR